MRRAEHCFSVSVLRGREEGNTFWSTMRPEDTDFSVRFLNDDTVAYDVLLNTEEAEARAMWAKTSPWGWAAYF